MADSEDPIKQSGQIDFSGGVNSVVVPTIASDANPHGLQSNQLAWLVNCGVRDGGITQRAGWTKKSPPGGIAANLLAISQGLFQGETFYDPDEGNPYKIVSIGGHILMVDVDFASAPVDLTEVAGLVGKISATSPQYFFVQAENFLVIQDGTETNLPLFWDGTTLSQSNGITGTLVRGAPQPATFQITTTQSWTIPAQGATSAIIPLSGPFPGNLGDNFAISGTAINTGHGTFRVVTVGAQGIQLYGVAPVGAGATVAAGVLVCQYATPGLNSGGTEDIGYTPQPVILSQGFWNVPAVGKTGTVLLTAVYPGSVGDVVEIYSQNWPAPGSTDYGNFTVVSFNSSFQLTLRCNSSALAGTQVNHGDFLFSIQSVRAFSQVIPAAGAGGHGGPFIIPAVGGTMLAWWNAFDGHYNGSLYDIVKVTVQGGLKIGVFRVINLITHFDGDHAYPRATLERLAVGDPTDTEYIGNSYSSITVQVVVSPVNPFYVPFNTGQWTVPNPGDPPVTLEIIYEGQALLPFALGPAYPGDIGDIITLYNSTGTINYGTFQVTDYDFAGGIALKTVATTYGGAIFQGAGGFLLAITTLPSTTGLNINQIPAARQMIYYMGRIFYNVGNTVNGGDIVGGPSGTSANGYKDSVLSVTENPLVFGGDGFTLPTQSGDITGFSEPNTVDASLGQGLLLISTRKAIYAMTVPLSRNDWIAANANNQPKIVEVQFDAGFASDNANVLVNGDVYYLTWKKDIRSLIQATRLFGQPGNVPCSAEEHRILKFTDATLLNFASGIQFDNRLLMTALPMQTPYGVVHQAILPLDFTPISTNRDRQQPVWEGHLEGLQILFVSEQDFDGVDRAFALTVSADANFPGAIDLWEFTTSNRFENEGQPSEARVTWQVEFPAMEWGDITRLKKLVSAEIWFDRLWGTVEFSVDWRPDSDACWKPWMKWKECSARNSNESPGQPAAYPTPYFEGFRATRTLPKPPESCESATGRPAHIGYQMQARLTVKGFCRVRGFWLLAEFQNRKLYASMVGAINELKEFCSNIWKFIVL